MGDAIQLVCLGQCLGEVELVEMPQDMPASFPLLGIAAVSVGGGLPLWPENREEYVIKNML